MDFYSKDNDWRHFQWSVRKMKTEAGGGDSLGMGQMATRPPTTATKPAGHCAEHVAQRGARLGMETYSAQWLLEKSARPLHPPGQHKQGFNKPFTHRMTHREQPPWATFLSNNRLVWVRPSPVSLCRIMFFRS